MEEIVIEASDCFLYPYPLSAVRKNQFFTLALAGGIGFLHQRHNVTKEKLPCYTETESP